MSVITFCHSEKGGVGKSLMAIVLADKLIHDGKRLILLDADLSNADLHREFSGIKINETNIEIYQFNLSQKNGWWDLYNLMSKEKDVEVQIVVSLPAQIESTMIDQRKEFKNALDSLGFKLNMIWMLSEAIDSVQLLKHTVSNNKDLIDKLIIVKNGFFAEVDEFSDWQNSNLRKDLLKNENISEVFLPELNKRLKRALKPIKMPFSQALKSGQLDFSERMGLEDWLSDARAVFASVS